MQATEEKWELIILYQNIEGQMQFAIYGKPGGEPCVQVARHCHWYERITDWQETPCHPKYLFKNCGCWIREWRFGMNIEYLRKVAKCWERIDWTEIKTGNKSSLISKEWLLTCQRRRRPRRAASWFHSSSRPRPHRDGISSPGKAPALTESDGWVKYNEWT